MLKKLIVSEGKEITTHGADKDDIVVEVEAEAAGEGGVEIILTGDISCRFEQNSGNVSNCVNRHGSAPRDPIP